LQDQGNIMSGQLYNLQKRRDSLVAEIAKMQRVLKSFDLSINTPLVPVKVDGIVTAVGQNKLEISIGGDDGLRVGDSLYVSRRGNFLASVEVIKVNPDRSVVQVKSRQGPVQVQDRVETRPKRVAQITRSR
jgi:hypothetical protein